MKQDTLLRRIQDEESLSLETIDQLVKLLGCGCRQKTKDRLRTVLGYVPYVQAHNVYGRVFLKDDGAPSYCAGQSYPDEIRAVRNLLLGRY